MRLTDEQELYVRQTLARRVKALTRSSLMGRRSSDHTEGWNEALIEAATEIMGGDPLSFPDAPSGPMEGSTMAMEPGPGIPTQQTVKFGKRRDRSYVPVEDVDLP